MNIDTTVLLNDVATAEALLDGKDALTPSDVVFALQHFLKMKYFPVAVKYFFSAQELDAFKERVDYKISLKALTFCHFMAASRQRGDVLLATPDRIGCSNAQYVWGLKELDEQEIKSHLKYTKDLAQAERFVRTKKRLTDKLLAVATAPLHLADFIPDVIHGACDVLQAYHLGNDWCAAHDVHPFEMNMTMNSSVCHGCVQAFVTDKPNLTTMCSGSYTAGKTEQGELNFIFPGDQLEPTVHWMLERIVRDGGPSFPANGTVYPGFDVCKLCPYIAFTDPRK